MRRWFVQFPFPGWLFLFLCFLIGDAALYIHERSSYSKKSVVAKIQTDLLTRQSQVESAHATGLFSLPVNQDEWESLQNEFGIILVQSDKITAWNTQEIPLNHSSVAALDSLSSEGLFHAGHGIYYAQKFPVNDSGDYVTTLIPIAFQYHTTYRYFYSHFVAVPEIKSGISVADSGTAIVGLQGETLFHLSFEKNPLTFFKITGAVGLLTILFFICLLIWVQKNCEYISKRYQPVIGWIALAIFCILFTYGRIFVGYPWGFTNTSFFSPKLLSSGVGAHSLPDLIFDVSLDFWLVFYIVKYVPVKDFIIGYTHWQQQVFRGILGLLFVFLLFHRVASHVAILVIDSKLPFVVNDLSHLSGYTFVGIYFVCLVTLTCLGLVHIIALLFKNIYPRFWFRYSAFILIGLIYIFLLPKNGLMGFNIAMLVMCVIAMLIMDWAGLPISSLERRSAGSGSPQVYLWFVFLCFWVAGQIFYFNFSKERGLREVYAARQSQENTGLLRFSFNRLSEQMQQDKLIQNFWKRPTHNNAMNLNRHITYQYLDGVFRNFDATIYYFDKNRLPLLAQNIQEKALLSRVDSVADSVVTNGLVSLTALSGKHLYWGMFPVYAPSSTSVMGYVGIDFSKDNLPKHQYGSLLFQPKNSNADEQFLSDYSYAIYRNHKLETQSGKHIFPHRSYFDAHHHTYVFRDSWLFSKLFYQVSPEELIVVYYGRNLVSGMISLFSYVLILWLLLFGLLFLVENFILYPHTTHYWRKYINLTIRAKVNWTIMAVVLLSLLVVGSITVSFLKSRYQQTKRQNLSNLMFFFGQNIVRFIDNKKSLKSFEKHPSPGQYSQLSELMTTLSAEQGVAINLYNRSGKLTATSQTALWQQQYLSSLMNPQALGRLHNGLETEWQTDERIGQLGYHSLYLPLRNKQDHIIAYLNLRYYASQVSLKSELSGILTTLINIYMLIFFIAGIAALLISNSIVRSFYLLIEQFRRIRLEHNALIRWPYKDELGILVQEYNNMILKVEKMASRLANNEREAAWRELALQVAHEIKNPLTPMKLNIQYLKRAVESGRSDISALIEHVSDSLITQIENLNLIASEFAHFARMPEPNLEQIAVSEQLESLIQLYHKDNTRLILEETFKGVMVWMDKSYFIRVFTNLIKNALQSIPEDRVGVVAVSIEKGDENAVRISIQDNGSGIPESIQSRIFTPYFTTKSSGTGIGLAMTKKMVESAGGTIGFISRLDVGTEFYVSLPVYKIII